MSIENVHIVKEGDHEPARSFVVKSEVQRIIKDLAHQTGGDFTDALSRQVETMIRRAVKRAADNGRKKVRGHDL